MHCPMRFESCRQSRTEGTRPLPALSISTSPGTPSVSIVARSRSRISLAVTSGQFPFRCGGNVGFGRAFVRSAEVRGSAGIKRPTVQPGGKTRSGSSPRQPRRSRIVTTLEVRRNVSRVRRGRVVPTAMSRSVNSCSRGSPAMLDRGRPEALAVLAPGPIPLDRRTERLQSQPAHFECRSRPQGQHPFAILRQVAPRHPGRQGHRVVPPPEGR